ncbi:mechanosensitive ion channel family protein [Skeletonema marinoi]|uniref:Mechanosensitive ion channel family protein n=1 Tax=Skeletonema marinoi TaxID=267567 RepID=A0AAD8Y090_9STRA|nr:mechanosensitive ion channel family protein [Skeletonema marinoi]
MTLQLAYGSEYVIVDVLALRSTVLLGLLGPLPILYIIQAKGWPLVSIFWGLWSLALIQNMDGWLAWTDIEMFTVENHDGGILSGDTYLEVLASLIMIGVATTIKRTVLALYLGKRIYFHYKKKVERVMLEMLLITEVSDLSQAIDDFEFIEEEEKAARKPSTKGSIAQTFKNTTMADIAKKQLRRDSGITENDSEEEDKNDEEMNLSLSTDDGKDSDEEKSSQLLPNNPAWNTLRRDTSTQSDTSDVSAPVLPLQPAHSIEQISEVPEGPPPVQDINEPVRNHLRGTSTTSQIKSLLYRWEEPVNKQDKEIEDPTIHEILQFRKALSFLEDSHPFGLSFGPAFSRDSCIKSSKALYKRLLALTPDQQSFTLTLLVCLHTMQMTRLTRGRQKSCICSICDSAYKKLRYLRAGTGNSTLIDEVLENFFNGAFSFCLALAVMTILKMNPWTLLVSLSTILVSFAFAFGPSLAQFIEGCIMIAVRRPFDLGDRIAIADASDKPQDCDPGYGATWLVEDCNLFTTTLRLAKSNEIATVKNGNIADKKIINHNRSDRAVVNIVLSLKSTVTHEEATIVKSAIEQYISDNPRIWAQLINFRIIDVDPCNDITKILVRVQHYVHGRISIRS